MKPRNGTPAWRGAAIACLALAALVAARAHGYGYPIDDRFLSTVVGTPPQLQAGLPDAASVPFRKRRIEILPDRSLPGVIAYNRQMLYTAALQKRGAAPVMFLIAGTGAPHNAAKNLLMARAFYEQGYHVVALSSPTYPNFIASASSTGVPGHARRDAEDLYRAMQMAWDDVRGRRTAIGFRTW